MLDSTTSQTLRFVVRQTTGLIPPFPNKDDKVVLETSRDGSAIVHIRNPRGFLIETLRGRIDQGQRFMTGKYAGYGEFLMKPEGSRGHRQLRCEIHASTTPPRFGEGDAGCWIAEEDDTRNGCQDSSRH